MTIVITQRPSKAHCEPTSHITAYLQEHPDGRTSVTDKDISSF